MTRREFTNYGIGLILSTIIPFRELFKRKWKTPNHSPAGIITDGGWVSLYSPRDKKSYWMKAASNIDKQDIINEIKEKWNSPNELITTCAVEFTNLKTKIRGHMRIGEFKKYYKDRMFFTDDSGRIVKERTTRSIEQFANRMIQIREQLI